jgi:hypothetical protein
MSDEAIKSEAASAEAVNAAANAAEAVERSREAQIMTAVDKSIAKFFDRGVHEKKFIDVGRIPFICDDISGIHQTLKIIDEKAVTKQDIIVLQGTVTLLRNIVFGFVTLVLLGAASVVWMAVAAFLSMPK